MSPRPAHVAQRCPLRKPPRLADHLADPFKFADELLIAIKNVVKCVGHFLRDAVLAEVEPDGKVAFFESVESCEKLPSV